MSHFKFYSAMDFGKYSALSKNKVMTNVINSKGSWNIRCTESLPVKYFYRWW
ncbi:csuB domain protein [Acinetobacter baumannii 44467_3]|nr:csuB domain protein [Acinetobacter baumannii 44467_3]